MRRIYFLLITALVITFSAHAQVVKISDNPEQFMADVQKLMATGSPVSVRAGTNLQALWTENRLSQPQRDRLMALSRKMNAKRYQPVAHFAPLFETFYNAAYSQKPAAQPVSMDDLLTLAEKQFTNGDAKAFGQVMNATRLFLERRLLYTGTYNKLYAEGGTFSFRYLDQPTVGLGGDTSPTNSTASGPTAATTAPTSNFDGWDDPMPGDSTKPRQLGVVMMVQQKRQIPAVSGPVLTIKDVFLTMVANGDSLVIPNTGGDLMLNMGIFVGKGGKFDWTTVGRPDIFVTLGDYSINVMNPRLQADDVMLSHPASPKPVKGVFEYSSKKKGSPQAAQFPRFMSWQNDVALPDLGKDVTYKGGFALAGSRIVGASASGQPAIITVMDNGKPAFRVKSSRFEFTDVTYKGTAADSSFSGGLLPGESLGGTSGRVASLITAASAQFVGYIDADSITHPSVQFRYDKNARVAWLNRQERSSFARVPFTDTYHKFYIQPEVMRWDVSRRKVDFYQVGAKREVPVRMESFDYFVPERYSNISIDYGFHPLQIAANYISKNKTQTFLADDLAQFARLNPNTLGGALERMVIEGYLDKDPNTGFMRLSRKGILYVLAYNKQKDYDNFQIQSQFVSNDSVKNATINLNDKFLLVRGVRTFTISDSLKIYGVPTDKVLKIGKGRAFTLNGQLKSGNFRYSGRNMAFDYDKFAMNLNKIDSITFTPQKLAAQGKTDEVGGDIKYDKPGMVYFGTPDNKSGQVKDKKTTQRLVMPEGMTVYFNQPTRENLAYNDKVYFKIPAIDNDSLGKGDISFIGTFYSDGIFPPFKAELKTMPDNTLGFTHKAPTGGYPVYGGKPGAGASTPGSSNVKFAGELSMDKSGLRADGVLNHLTASLTTGGMLFMTDSLLASGSKGEIKEGVSGKPGPKQVYFPAVQVNDYSLKWWPKADSMVIMTQKGNFNFYNGSTKLEGNLVLRTGGLFGNGTLRRTDSEALSTSIKFNKDGFLAEDAQFKIESAGPQKGIANKPILLGTGLDVDFNQVKGVVGLAINAPKNQTILDTLKASMEFPYAAYKTSINRAQWNINAKTIAMKGDVKTSTFTATGEEQEELTFNGAAALYDVEKMALNISGVPFVTSADAHIIPDKGLVSIKRNGEMMPFKNARLELDTISLHHKLKNGNIQVLSRTRFSGDATYQFATAAGDTASIKMGSFEFKESTAAPATASTQATPDLTAKSAKGRRKGTGSQQTGTTYYTVARAEIDENDKLQLAPRMMFKGGIVMQAPEKDLSLDGFIKPSLKKRPDLIGGWIPFKEKVVERIEIKVDKNLKNEGDQPLVAGIHYRGGQGGLYPTFLSPKEDQRDDDIFTVTGLMRYDEKDKVFRIVQKGADGLEDLENAFTFNDPRGSMTYKGPMTFMNTGETSYLMASGSANINIDSTKYRLNTLLAFTFPVPELITAEIGKKLVEANLEEQNDEPADDDLNALSDKLVPLIGQKEVDVYRTKAQNQHVSLALASPKLAVPIVLSNVELRWSEKAQAFYSIGPLGVSNMGAADINAQMNGFVEIRKTANGDEATIYVESSDEVWAFYEFKSGGNGGGGQLAITTSDQAINDKLLAGSKNAGKSAVEIIAATPDEKEQFVALYQSQYKTRVRPAPAPKPSTIATPAPKSTTPAPTAKPDASTSAAQTNEKAVATGVKTPAGAIPSKPGSTTAFSVELPGAKNTGVDSLGVKIPADKAVVKKDAVTPKEKEKKKAKEEEKEGF